MHQLKQKATAMRKNIELSRTLPAKNARDKPAILKGLLQQQQEKSFTEEVPVKIGKAL